MTFDELKEKAQSLPLAPGVYVMRNADNEVIYVGKAKKLKNRVSQYFQNTASHNAKTRMMVSKIHHFDTIIAASEFEALVLECSLIKRYLPKYNILLKDDKGYPYLRLDLKEAYPRITLAPKLQDDGASYFGPYGARSLSHQVIETIEKTLKLPSCGREFPRDFGKGRPCLNYHMGLCAGWCKGDQPPDAYRQAVGQAKMLLSGDYKGLTGQIKKEMLEASENLAFEQAAQLRDRLRAVEALGQKQLVTAGAMADMDAIGYAVSGKKACFTVLHFAGGNLIDKEYEILSALEEEEDVISSLVKQYYLARGLAPKVVLLPRAMEDSDLFEELLQQQYGRRTRIRVPQRGDNAQLVEMARKNALEEAARLTTREEKQEGLLRLLGKMLALEDRPQRIESYDISNLGNQDIVASMVVFQGGQPCKSEYKRFKLEDMEHADDYASMRQIITRRFTHYVEGDKGFDSAPDLLLIDGGVEHACCAVEALSALGLTFPVFGMVKDNRHRTRALVTPDGEEIRIDQNQSIFAFIGTIQEETHRFAITYNRSLRSRRLKKSAMDDIPSIGPKRREKLLKFFKSVTAIREASLMDLEAIIGPAPANAVYRHFHKEDPSCVSSPEPPKASS